MSADYEILKKLDEFVSLFEVIMEASKEHFFRFAAWKTKEEAQNSKPHEEPSPIFIGMSQIVSIEVMWENIEYKNNDACKVVITTTRGEKTGFMTIEQYSKLEEHLEVDRCLWRNY